MSLKILCRMMFCQIINLFFTNNDYIRKPAFACKKIHNTANPQDMLSTLLNVFLLVVSCFSVDSSKKKKVFWNKERKSLKNHFKGPRMEHVPSSVLCQDFVVICVRVKSKIFNIAKTWFVEKKNSRKKQEKLWKFPPSQQTYENEGKRAIYIKLAEECCRMNMKSLA